MEQLISDIREYCKATGIRETTFGMKAGYNSRLIDRIERKSILPRTEDRIRAYMRNNPPTPTTNKVAAQ